MKKYIILFCSVFTSNVLTIINICCFAGLEPGSTCCGSIASARRPLFIKNIWALQLAQTSGVGPEVVKLLAVGASLRCTSVSGPCKKDGDISSQTAKCARFAKGKPPRSKHQVPGRARYHAHDAC